MYILVKRSIIGRLCRYSNNPWFIHYIYCRILSIHMIGVKPSDYHKPFNRDEHGNTYDGYEVIRYAITKQFRVITVPCIIDDAKRMSTTDDHVVRWIWSKATGLPYEPKPYPPMIVGKGASPVWMDVPVLPELARRITNGCRNQAKLTKTKPNYSRFNSDVITSYYANKLGVTNGKVDRSLPRIPI